MKNGKASGMQELKDFKERFHRIIDHRWMVIGQGGKGGRGAGMICFQKSKFTRSK